MTIAVRVENISKQFRIGSKQDSYRTMRDAIAESAAAPFRRLRGLLRGEASAASNLNEIFWALQNVSFDIQQGEVVGIIGRNGAGKSTLLKILSRITEPTQGKLWIRGRVGALLEVGTGFHQELTGRENVFLNGAILGMSRLEIERKFDEIVAFAEIEKFIDTPVKHYSSGMGLRLGFAVAAHLEPEILIIDEVLAVGDAAFQKKCLGKMSDVAGQGRTVLFVSHNMIAVQSLCSRAIWLDQGKIVQDGRARDVVTDYLNTGVMINTERVWPDIVTAPGNESVKLHRVSVKSESGTRSEPITVSTPIVIEFEYWNLKPGTRLNLSYGLNNEQGIMAFSSASVFDPTWENRPFPEGLFRSYCYIPGDLLNDGVYRIELYIVKDHVEVLYSIQDVLSFQVLETPKRLESSYRYHGKWYGVVRPDLKWATEKIPDPAESVNTDSHLERSAI